MEHAYVALRASLAGERRGLLQLVAQGRATFADTGIHARLADTAPIPTIFLIFPTFLGGQGAVFLLVYASILIRIPFTGFRHSFEILTRTH